MRVTSHSISPISATTTTASCWSFISSLSRSGILFLSMSASTKVPAFVFLLHHIPLFALICTCPHCRTFCLFHHCHPYPTQRYPPSCFKFYFCHLPWVLSCSSSFFCQFCQRQIRKLTIRLCIPLGDVFVRVFFGFVPPFYPCFLMFICLMYVFSFHLISFVALYVLIGSFGNSVLFCHSSSSSSLHLRESTTSENIYVTGSLERLFSFIMSFIIIA